MIEPSWIYIAVDEAQKHGLIVTKSPDCTPESGIVTLLSAEGRKKSFGITHTAEKLYRGDGLEREVRHHVQLKAKEFERERVYRETGEMRP